MEREQVDRRRLEDEAGNGRSETPLERLDRNLQEMLSELRIVVTGVQVLFAFLLVVPFNSGFANIGPFERAVRLDPQFAAAHLRLAMVKWWNRPFEARQPFVRRYRRTIAAEASGLDFEAQQAQPVAQPPVADELAFARQEQGTARAETQTPPHVAQDGRSQKIGEHSNRSISCAESIILDGILDA